MFWKKLIVLSSAPLSVTLSFLPDNFMNSRNILSQTWLSAAHAETTSVCSELTEDAEKPISPCARKRHTMEALTQSLGAGSQQTRALEASSLTSDQLQQQLIEHGYNEQLAQKVVSYAACASGLSDAAFKWQNGERRSGIFMIPDSKQDACGYSDLEVWEFRELMHKRHAAVQCRATLERRGLLDAPLPSCRNSSLVSLSSKPDAEKF